MKQPLTSNMLQAFKEQSSIAQTGKDLKKREFRMGSRLDAVMWIGENAHILIDEIERLRPELTHKPQ